MHTTSRLVSVRQLIEECHRWAGREGEDAIGRMSHGGDEEVEAKTTQRLGIARELLWAWSVTCTATARKPHSLFPRTHQRDVERRE